MNRKLPARITDLLTVASSGDDSLLLRELQHRHANDLTVVAAALTVCGRKLRAGSPRAAMLRDIAHKVQAIGEVNVILSNAGTGDVEDLAPTLEMLCEAAERRSPNNVRVLVSAQSLPVRDFVCRRLALVVNELILNAVKHGATGADTMLVTVKLSDNGSATHLSVYNDSVDTRWERSGGQGFGLVDEMVSRMGGEVIRCKTIRGARVDLLFPTLAVIETEEPF